MYGIAVLQSILLCRVIKTGMIYTIARYTCRGTLVSIVHWPTALISFMLRFILNCHATLFFSQALNLYICGISEHNFFETVRDIHKLCFLSTTTHAYNKLRLPRPIDYWKTEHYQMLSDCGEVDLDSDVNHLASGNLRQYTTLPSKFDKLNWTWTLCILYFDLLFHLDKCPGIV